MSTAPKRRWRTFSLRTFLVVTLLLSVVLGYFGRAWWKAYRDSQPPTLHELAQIAKRHGIPMPPKGAKLVLACIGIDGRIKPSRGMYSPGFLLPDRGDGLERVLVGWEERALEHIHRTAPLRRTFSLDPARPNADGYSLHLDEVSSLVCAVQLAECDDGVNAAALFDQLAEGQQWFTPDKKLAADVDLRLMMARCAYSHLANLVQTQPSRWPELRSRLDALLAEFPKLREEPCGDVSRDLALAVDAPSPAAGSVEALLVEWSRRNIYSNDPFGSPIYYERDQANAEYLANAPAREIVSRGFDAVPELIALLKDRRLTAHSWHEYDGTPQFRRLGELADDLLRGISGFNALGDSLSVPVSDGETDPDALAWRRWLPAAKSHGEREYLIANLFSDQGRLNEPLAYILAHKYPESVFDLVTDLFHSERRHGDVFDLVLPIRDANLPVKQRVELLVVLFQKAPSGRRENILCALAQLDQARATYFTLQLLDEYPIDLEGYYEGYPELRLVVVVSMLDDIRAWRSLLKTARRAKAGVRLRMLGSSAYLDADQQLRANRIALLAAFLDDEDTASKTVLGDHGPGSTAQIAVCDFAADTLAWWLDIEPHSNRERTPKQWSALREQVRQRLAEEELPELE